MNNFISQTFLTFYVRYILLFWTTSIYTQCKEYLVFLSGVKSSIGLCAFKKVKSAHENKRSLLCHSSLHH